MNAAAAGEGARAAGDPFQRLLSAAQGPNAEQQVRQAATKFVSSAFVKPVLEMMHESPFAEEPFKPNAAQRRFTPLLDQHMADRITRGANFPLVDRIVEQVLNAAGASSTRTNSAAREGIDVSA